MTALETRPVLWEIEEELELQWTVIRYRATMAPAARRQAGKEILRLVRILNNRQRMMFELEGW